MGLLEIERRIVTDANDLKALESCWNLLLDRGTAGRSILRPGVSNTYEWHVCLLENGYAAFDFSLLVARVDGEPVAIFPRCRTNAGWKQKLIPAGANWQQLYATRSALIARLPEPAVVRGVCAELGRGRHDAVMELTVLAGSTDEVDLLSACDQLGIGIHVVARRESVFVDLTTAIETGTPYFDTLDKKFRYNVSSRERKLADLGELRFVVMSRPSECSAFLDAVLSIERHSWKEDAGTSITQNAEQIRFYEAFTPVAASMDWLRGAVLMLNGEPIAYSYGIVFNGTFESLKSSFDERYKKYGPGNVIKKHLLDMLQRDGLDTYDLMGEVEPSKLKWQPVPYERVTYALYANSVRGRCGYLAKRWRSADNRFSPP